MHESNRDKTQRYRAGRFKQEKKSVQITHIDGKPIEKTMEKHYFIGRLRRLPKPKDITQKKALRNLAMFLLLMLLLTLIALGTADASLARVTTIDLSAGEIMESFRGTGKVSADGFIYVDVPAELSVREVLTTPGAALKAGDGLIRFDAEEIAQSIEMKNIELKEKQHQLDTLMQDSPTDNTTLAGAERALSWAEQDYADAKKEGNQLIAAAKQVLAGAKDELEVARMRLEELKNNASASLLMQEDSDISESETESESTGLIEQAEAAVIAAEEKVKNAQAMLADAENAAAEKLKAAARAIENAEQSLESARIAATVQSQEKENRQKQNLIEAETMRLDAEKLKETIAWLEALKVNGGILKTEKEGIAEKLPAANDKAEIGAALVTLADTSGGFEAELSVSRDEAERLSVGGRADIVKQTGYMYGGEQYEGKILSISGPDENAMARVRVGLPEGDFKQGESLDIRLISGSKVYNSCLPLAAIHSDSAGHFILVLDKHQTVLGDEEVLRKIPVTVVSSGDGSAAVEGAFSYDDRVLLNSTKPVAEGDRVRVEL